MSNSNRLLIKLQPSAALAAADSRANLRPLYGAATPESNLGLAATPAWYLADVQDGGETAWDAAHARVADQLGIDQSGILFVEPDLTQTIYLDPHDRGRIEGMMATGIDCQSPPQQTDAGGRALGPDEFAWHLGDRYTQLGTAREAVQFTDPNRTRIAHLDTGYDRNHTARPERILRDLERSFVEGEDPSGGAQDPLRGSAYPDNSGHGTGTIGILAGGKVAELNNKYLGGAPQADILPLRVSNSVLLFKTSAFAQALQYAIQQRCDVITLSMGGLPSRAWNEAVNAAYEQGICIVAAAGNSLGGLPTHNVVYPARYRRTITACGVMADGRPYYNLDRSVLEGNWGPNSSMVAALATYTPNIPWPMFGCPTGIRLNGEGTSSATPQIAAAVALWYEKYKMSLSRDWHRVEAVRNALFRSAKNKSTDPTHFGNGILQANDALAIAPAFNLPKTPPDDDSFSFFRVITGLGLTEPTTRETMFNLELTQRWLLNAELQRIVPEPAAALSQAKKRQFMDALMADKQVSQALRKHLASRYSLLFPAAKRQAATAPVAPPARKNEVSIPKPPHRRIRAYAVDPSFSTRLDTAAMNEVVMKVRWEDLTAGPTGEYLEVVDEDGNGSGVDLNHPRLLAQDGLAPSEGNLAFHQQMVYAVAMTTIANFERALGRPVLWRPKPNPDKEFDDRIFVRRLRIRPHALHQANAFYSPQEIALLFGYFEAAANDPGDHVPGTTVYTCLSHDIVAHETTHAILDGRHRRFNEASNPDVLAFHEAFADIVALMQHFTIPEVLENEINRTRGNLEEESMLGSLAVQFGRAMGGSGALRDAIGKVDKNGVWTRQIPNPADLAKQTIPHARGAILVAAVFDAFLAIYKARTIDLLRIYTSGTGVLPTGSIHPDLARRLAAEAAKSASHVLTMCIRALDYIPPVDITFGEYLRGLITADFDLVEDDQHNYRVAFVEAFRRRGIHPAGVKTLSVDDLRWQGIDLGQMSAKARHKYQLVLEQLREFANACLYLHDRKDLYDETRKQRILLHRMLREIVKTMPDFARLLGLNPKESVEVHELHRSLRISPDGKPLPQIIAALTQVRPLKGSSLGFRGGTTLVIDLSAPAIQYAITKSIDNPERQAAMINLLQQAEQDPLQALLLTPQEPFAALHALTDLSG